MADVPHDRQVVADEQERQAELALQAHQQIDDLRPDRDVERDTGSSHTISFGRRIIARAMPIRWH